jgi:hypothetical protein
MQPALTPSGATAGLIFLTCTLAMLALTFAWSTINRKPVRAHEHLLGRRATPYWHHPNGLADERGITTRLGATPAQSAWGNQPTP